MQVFLVACITFFSQVWGNNYMIIKTEDEDPAPVNRYAKTEAGSDYSDDEPIKAETLICQHMKDNAFDEFVKMPDERKRKIVEEMNQYIVNSRNRKERGDDGDYFFHKNDKILENIKDITRETQHLLSGINSLLGLVDLPKPPSKIPKRREFCFMEFERLKKSKKSKKCKNSKKCKKSKKYKKPKDSKELKGL